MEEGNGEKDCFLLGQYLSACIVLREPLDLAGYSLRYMTWMEGVGGGLYQLGFFSCRQFVK